MQRRQIEHGDRHSPCKTVAWALLALALFAKRMICRMKQASLVTILCLAATLSDKIAPAQSAQDVLNLDCHSNTNHLKGQLVEIYASVISIAACLSMSHSLYADEPSAFGSGFDVQEFYGGFTLDEITPQNQQKWPYYRYVSAHWDKYAGHDVAVIKASEAAKLSVVDGENRQGSRQSHRRNSVKPR